MKFCRWEQVILVIVEVFLLSCDFGISSQWNKNFKNATRALGLPASADDFREITHHQMDAWSQVQILSTEEIQLESNSRFS